MARRTNAAPAGVGQARPHWRRTEPTAREARPFGLPPPTPRRPRVPSAQPRETRYRQARRQGAGELAHCLAQNAEAVCRHYLSNGRRSGGYWHVGDVANTPGQSLYVRLSGARAGKWCDAATAQHGDLLDLIAASCKLASLKQALAEARQFLEVPADPTPPRTERGASDKTLAAQRLFGMGRPITRHTRPNLPRTEGHHPPRAVAVAALSSCLLLSRWRRAGKATGAAGRHHRPQRTYHRHPAHLAGCEWSRQGAGFDAAPRARAAARVWRSFRQCGRGDARR